MISYLYGVIKYKTDETAVVVIKDSIGYEVYMTAPDLNKVNTKEETELFCHHHISDRNQELYCFLNVETRNLFRLLIVNVSGIGPRSSIKLVSKIDAKTFTQAIICKNTDVLEAFGIGKKTAEKIIVGLENKIKAEKGGAEITESFGIQKQEALEALISLDYRKLEVSDALKQIKEQGKTTEEIIKEALKIL